PSRSAGHPRRPGRHGISEPWHPPPPRVDRLPGAPAAAMHRKTHRTSLFMKSLLMRNTRTTFGLAVLSVVGLLLAVKSSAPDERTPSLNEALAWLQGLPIMGGGVNMGMDPLRFKKLTLDDLKTLKEIQIGGHLVDKNGKTLPEHVTLPDADYLYLTA